MRAVSSEGIKTSRHQDFSRLTQDSANQGAASITNTGSTRQSAHEERTGGEAHGTRGQDLCRSRATSSEMSGLIRSSDLREVRKRTAMADKASLSRASYLRRRSHMTCASCCHARDKRRQQQSATDFSRTFLLRGRTVRTAVSASYLSTSAAQRATDFSTSATYSTPAHTMGCP